MTLIDWTAVTLIDWDEPGPAYLSTITLTDAQAQAVFNGAPITVAVRSIADSIGNYPSVVYGVSMGILGGGTLSDHLYEWEKLFVAPWEPVTLAPSGDQGSIVTIVPDSGRVAAGDTLVFKVDGAPGGASRSARVLVTDAVGESVGVVTRSDTAFFVQLGSLDPLDGPFEVHVQSTTDQLSGTAYHCPANTPDCEQFNPSRDACDGGSCTNGAVCCRGANDYAECIDLSANPDNCGACGWPCGPNEMCLDGVCAVVTSLDCDGTTCPDALSCCEDPNGMPRCVERKSDNGNCGWCGHTCAANKRCEFGLCLPRWGEKCGTSCSGGKTCCYTVLGGSQCVNTTNSALSCGKCGNVCGFGETCSGGKCVPWLSVYDPCWGGRTNCGAPDGIDCRNLLTDSANCGACRLICPEGGACVSGRCTDPGEKGIPDNCGEQR